MTIDERLQLKFYFKALADESRLQMIGLLSKDEHTVGDLASLLELRDPTISHHLSKLRSVGLVRLRTDGNKRYYRLNHDTLATFKEAVSRIEEEIAPTAMPTNDTKWIDKLPFDDDAKKIIREYTFAGRIRQLPRKESKYLIILDWLILQFEADKVYKEREINEIIKQFYFDYAALRRGLIEYGYMRREPGGSRYWVAENDMPER